MPSRPIVFVVDDDESILEATAALVGEMGIACKTYSSAEAFLRDYDGHRPGCLVSDMRMLGMSGIELLERLRSDRISLAAVILTAYAETRTTVRAIKAGAVTLLEKPCGDHDLWDAIRTGIVEDEQQHLREHRVSEIRNRLESLTPAEMRVVERILKGDSNKRMAHNLGVSVRTIEVRRSNIFKKMGADSVAELVRMYLEVHPKPDSSSP